MWAVMLVVIEAAIDDCVKRCDGIVAATLTVF
jgi:hypothetical protein